MAKNQFSVKDDELLSIPRFAEYAGGLSKWTVRAWLSQGKIRRTKVGRRTMIRMSELERLIKEGK
jgi:excisionase family DNA binding protein